MVVLVPSLISGSFELRPGEVVGGVEVVWGDGWFVMLDSSWLSEGGVASSTDVIMTAELSVATDRIEESLPGVMTLLSNVSYDVFGVSPCLEAPHRFFVVSPLLWFW